MTGPDEAPAERCPHCGNLAELEPARRVRHRCRVCGGPRVPRDGHAVPVTRDESAALQRARRRTIGRAAWLAGAIALGSLGSLALLVTLAVVVLAQPGWMPALAALGITAAPILLSLYATGRARATGRALEADLDEAELAVARAIAERSETDLTAADLARALRRGEPEVERLLARLAAADVVRIRVTDQGTVVFTGPGAARRVRVETGSEKDRSSPSLEALPDSVEAAAEVAEAAAEIAVTAADLAQREADSTRRG